MLVDGKLCLDEENTAEQRTMKSRYRAINWQNTIVGPQLAIVKIGNTFTYCVYQYDIYTNKPVRKL